MDDEADDSDTASLYAQLKAAKNALAMANTLSGLRLTASTAMTDATNARKAAEQALEDAEKYDGMLGVIAVEG